jgi:pimeloyl-ACP methyl ester carboxylesterase
MNADPSLVDSEEWRHVDDELAAFAQFHGQDKAWLKQGRCLDEKLPDYGELYRSQAKSVGYDPQPYIEQLDIPMLYIFGENDENIPTTASVEYLENLQVQSGRDIEISVISGVDHTMITPTGFAFTGSYVPAFLDAIGPWAAAKVSTKSPSR